MPQVFTPAATLAIKLALLGAPLIAAGAVVTGYKFVAPQPAPEHAERQPIAFSHKHHVGDDGLDCRYCHATVETEAHAGMPATSVCLTCHSQLFRDSPLLAPLRESMRTGRPIAWVRIHDLPDFVFFDHSIHVAKGVGCVECHGRVDQMPLTRRVASLEMQWCLECHRNPGPHLRAARDVFVMGPAQPAPARLREIDDTRRLTDCSTCHR